MSRFLFIHQNFPGQYRHLAPALVRSGHEVFATVLRQTSGATTEYPFSWQGVELWPYHVERAAVNGQHPWLSDFEAKVLRGESCLKVLKKMRANGIYPDVVMAHLGWGEALFVKDVWPNAKLVIYCEFYYQAQGADVGFDPEFHSLSDEARCKLRLRNANQLLHLQAADAISTPTHWQASTFPIEYRQRMKIFHEGIDTSILTAAPNATVRLSNQLQLNAGDEVVTFVSRNLEPYRGYHTFMRALPELLDQRPKAHVLLIGGDKVGYGAAAPNGQSWKQIFANEVRKHMPMDNWARVHFLGRLPYDQYLAVMRVSAVHVYLTYPFVLSWSLLEAMSLGIAIVGSDTEPVKEVLIHEKNGLLVNFFDPSKLAHSISELLDNAQERQRLGQAARKFVCEHYDLHQICLPMQMDWLSTV